jgi:PhnB protein
MTTINPYLTFNGNCEAAFNFYKAVFGGEFQFIGRFKDMPPQKEYKLTEADMEKIMHVSLPISKGSVLMGSDSSDAFGKATIMGNNVTISIHTESVDEITRIYNELSKDGIIKMPLQKTFWGSHFGQFTDKFGINWMANCEVKEHKDFEEKHRKDQ